MSTVNEISLDDELVLQAERLLRQLGGLLEAECSDDQLVAELEAMQPGLIDLVERSAEAGLRPLTALLRCLQRAVQCVCQCAGDVGLKVLDGLRLLHGIAERALSVTIELEVLATEAERLFDQLAELSSGCRKAVVLTESQAVLNSDEIASPASCREAVPEVVAASASEPVSNAVIETQGESEMPVDDCPSVENECPPSPGLDGGAEPKVLVTAEETCVFATDEIEPQLPQAEKAAEPTQEGAAFAESVDEPSRFAPLDARDDSTLQSLAGEDSRAPSAVESVSEAAELAAATTASEASSVEFVEHHSQSNEFAVSEDESRRTGCQPVLHDTLDQDPTPSPDLGETSSIPEELADLVETFCADAVPVDEAIEEPTSKPAPMLESHHEHDNDAPPASVDDAVQESAFDVALSPELDQKAAFIDEAAAHCQRMAELLQPADGSEVTREALEEARRLVHTVKGAAGAIGEHWTARLAHRTEDLLERLIADETQPREEVHELLSCCLDTLAETLQSGPIDELLVLIDQRCRELGILDPTGRVGEEPQPAAAEPLIELSAAPAAVCEPSPEVAAEASVASFSQIELDNVAEISAEMREVFMEEAEDHLRAIYGAFARVETEGPTTALIRDIRRSAHTLKGAAGAVGFRVVSKWAHRMEDLLDKLQSSRQEASRETLQLLYETTDAIQDMVHGNYIPDDMRARLGRLLTRFDSLATPVESADPMAEEAVDAAPEVHEIEVREQVPVFAAAAAEPTTEEEAAAARPARAEASQGQLLRVPIERLEALARTVSELVINRTAFEQRMADLIRFVAENQSSVKRLRGISYDLETEFSSKLLGGRSRLSGGRSTPAGSLPADRAALWDGFDSLEFDRYGEFHVLARSLAEATNDIDTVGNELRGLLGDFDTLLNRQGRLAREAQNRIMRIRMIPLATLATRLHRTVRVVAQEQGKNVALEIRGENVELDKLVLEEIADPLLHLLRNAVDHGIEPPAVREAQGKPQRARISIHAFHQGTQVALRIQDDGRGLDLEKIRQTAVRLGVLSPSEADCSTEEDLQQLIFVPGFTTAARVSEISGRGVGMDVVRDKVQKLKGTIDIASTPGQGTTFTIRLPMTMAVTRALLVTANQETFALPIQVVQQILRIEKQDLAQLGGDSLIRIKDATYPVVRLADRLSLPARGDAAGDTVPALLVSAGDRSMAVIVDRILTSRDIVVKSLGNHLRSTRGLIGATLMGDGTVVPILDPLELVGAPTERSRSAGRLRVPAKPRERTSSRDTLKVMIVDDSVSVRRVMSNLIKNQGMIPVAAKDGVDALEILQNEEHMPDIFLLDIEMPRMDGYELLAALRRHPEFQETPVVMITSRAGEKHRTKAFQLGVNEYLTKPYRDEELLAAIRTLTGHRQPALVEV